MSTKLSIERLITFQAVAAAGSIKAATNGNEADEARFSKQISDLEEHFGAPLKHFTKKGLQLTKEGERLVRIARELQQGLEELRNSCKAQPLALKIGAGDRLLHWIVLPRLRAIQDSLPGSRIELQNFPTRTVIENVSNLTLDLGLVRIAEATSDLIRYKIPIQFNYALFVQEQLLPKECDGRWVIEHVPMAIVARYQNEFRKVAEQQRLVPHIRLLCSTFPQARRAVSSGYAAILPSTAFVASEFPGIRQFPLPFRVPEFEAEESNLALVWNKRSEKIRPEFRQAIDAFKRELCDSKPDGTSQIPFSRVTTV